MFERNFRISNLSVDQVNVLSKLNEMGRVSDTLRDALLKCFTSKRNSDSLICQSMDIVKLNFIDLFKSMCPLMNIDSGSTLKIEIISDEISESVCQERPNFLESLLDSKIEVNTVKNFRWKKRRR